MLIMGNSSVDFFQLILISFYCENMLSVKKKKKPPLVFAVKR